MPPLLRPFLTLLACLCLASPACSDRESSAPDRVAQPVLGDPLILAQRQKLTVADGKSGTRFGERLSLSGDTLIVGAPADNQIAASAGAAYVFVRGESGWALQQKLVVPGSAASDAFGASVAVSGDTAVVGAWGVDSASFDTGAAYVFTRTGTVWTQRAKLVADDPEEQDHFGVSVVISERNLVVAAPTKSSANQFSVGAAYAFTGSGSQWTFVSKLMPTNTANDNNGSGLALSGSLLAMGTNRLRGFVVTYFELKNGIWAPGAASISSTNANFAHFGSRLALSSKYTVIGSYADDLGSATTAGSVLVVDNAVHATQWTLEASDPAANDQFGAAVALSETGTLLVGSPRDDDQGNDAGSVYLFGLANGAWVEQQKLTALDGAANDRFGAAVATTGSAALVSAPGSAAGVGSLYALGFGWVNGSGCANDRECGSGRCIENVCCDAACDSLCRSCLAANTGGPNGTCGNVVAGTPCPNSTCVSSNVAPVTSACDSSGACTASTTQTCAAGLRCAAGTCSVAMGAGGSGGFAGGAGSSGGAALGGGGGSAGNVAGAAGDMGGSTSSVGGGVGSAGGAVGDASAGAPSAAGSRNASPGNGIGLACETHSDCPSSLGCDPTSNTCQDRIVTACSCRVAGPPGGSRSWAWLVVGIALVAERRRRFRASAAQTPTG